MRIEAIGVRELATAFGRMPDDIRRELRPKLRTAANLMADAAKANAAWSTRIPAAIKVTTSLTSRNGGAGIRVDSTMAPHARALEGITRNLTFRHPVFGQDVWVEQQTRPFLYPAIRAKAPEGRELVREAVRSAIHTRNL